MCKNASLAGCYLVAKVIHMQSLRTQICVYTHTHTHILHSIDAGRAKEIKKKGQKGMPRAKERYQRANVGTRVTGSHPCLQETRRTVN